jgi:hypothetical protein
MVERTPPVSYCCGEVKSKASLPARPANKIEETQPCLGAGETKGRESHNPSSLRLMLSQKVIVSGWMLKRKREVFWAGKMATDGEPGGQAQMEGEDQWASLILIGWNV